MRGNIPSRCFRQEAEEKNHKAKRLYSSQHSCQDCLMSSLHIDTLKSVDFTVELLAKRAFTNVNEGTFFSLKPLFSYTIYFNPPKKAARMTLGVLS